MKSNYLASLYFKSSDTRTRFGGFPLVRWFDCNAQLAGQQIGIGQTITVCGSYTIYDINNSTTIGPNC